MFELYIPISNFLETSVEFHIPSLTVALAEFADGNVAYPLESIADNNVLLFSYTSSALIFRTSTLSLYILNSLIKFPHDLSLNVVSKYDIATTASDIFLELNCTLYSSKQYTESLTSHTFHFSVHSSVGSKLNDSELNPPFVVNLLVYTTCSSEMPVIPSTFILSFSFNHVVIFINWSCKSIEFLDGSTSCSGPIITAAVQYPLSPLTVRERCTILQL